MCIRQQIPENHLLGDSTVKIQMRRKKIWKDTLRAFRQQDFTTKKWLQVEFIGEAAVDDGGPRREYFRWGMQEICNNSSLFQGQGNARVPTHNVHLLCNKEYQDIGRFFALSILQVEPLLAF